MRFCNRMSLEESSINTGRRKVAGIPWDRERMRGGDSQLGTIDTCSSLRGRKKPLWCLQIRYPAHCSRVNLASRVVASSFPAVLSPGSR